MNNVEIAIAGTENPVQRWTNIIAAIAEAVKNEESILCKVHIREEDGAYFLKTDKHQNKSYVYVFTSQDKTVDSDVDWLEFGEVLNVAYEVEQIDGVMLNFGTDNIELTKTWIETIFQMAFASEQEEVEMRELDQVLISDMEGCEWIPENACIVTNSGTEFSEDAQKTIQHVHYYMNEEKSFILFNDHVVLMTQVSPVVTDDEEKNEAYFNEMIKLAIETMEEGLSYHPDFSKYTMDDGMFAVELFNGMWCIREPEDFGEYATDWNGEPNLSVALEMREEILEACASGRILAIGINDIEESMEE